MLEHDDDDRYITEAVLDEIKADVSIRFASNSTEFLQTLEGSEKPDLLLITYRASPLNAVEVLKRVKSAARLKAIPVVVLSGVSNAAIARECYEAGASSVIIKPSSERDTTEKITTFLKYWFKTVELP